jgi:hypothetical protein
MKNTIKKCGQWKFRIDEIPMPKFRKLSPTEKQEYLDLIKGLPTDERSSMDEILIEEYHLNKTNTKNYFEL